MKLVIVESPTKAKTISHYLGKGYQVLASMGHVRELPSMNGSVNPDDNFSMKYQIREGAEKYLQKIISYAKKSEKVYLASDPDREGEAIAWNIAEILKDNKAISIENIQRVAFNEVTKKVVNEAINNPRSIDDNLVQAQQSRLALDYLVGFQLSPILWRKLPGSKSAGRVQSVALRMITERELDIRKFIPREYWSIAAQLKHPSYLDPIIAMITKYQDKKFDNSFPGSKSEVEAILQELQAAGHLIVRNISHKEIKQNPPFPFTTSTLQQEASKKLGINSSYTMRLAQKLYEGVQIEGQATGLITYIRTDGTSINEDAMSSIRQYIKENFDENYLPPKAKIYHTKIKNAQEAHEAIRPTCISLTPEEIKRHVNQDLYKLYKMIWLRTMACQMQPAVRSAEVVEFSTPDDKIEARISGSRIKFDGFLRLYKDTNKQEKTVVTADDQDGLAETSPIPKMTEGEKLQLLSCEPKQHFTLPPPRFTEHSLIKNLEELGIGRPSTYAMIISVLQARKYVTLEKRQFFAEHRGMFVATFLKCFFPKYVEYDFTAKLEEDLDVIASGKLAKSLFLSGFWEDFHKQVKATQVIDNKSVFASISQTLIPFFIEGANELPTCPHCQKGSVQATIGKYGPFLSCSNYPECKHVQKITDNDNSSNTENNMDNNIPKEEMAIELENGSIATPKNGRYGPYIEVRGKDNDVRNVSVPKDIDLSDKENILKYASLPRTIGLHPDSGESVIAGIGRYGPYLSHSGKYYKIEKDLLFEATIEQAVSIMAKQADKSGSSAVRFQHPDSGEEIKIGKSRYGVYAFYKKKYYGIKQAAEISEVTLEMALEVIER